MSKNKLRVELMSYDAQVWRDITADVLSANMNGIGMAAQGGQTSPRGNQAPGVGKAMLVLNNQQQNYNPLGASTVTATAGAVAGTQAIGTIGGNNQTCAQQFVVPLTGYLTALTFDLGASTGAPTGTMTWTLLAISGNLPSSTVLATGTFTPVASSTNRISLQNGPFVTINTNLFLALQSTSVQTTGNYWTWNYASGANGTFASAVITGGITGAWGSLGAETAFMSATVSSLLWTRELIRVRGTGASLGNCLQVYSSGSRDAASFYQQVTTAIAAAQVFTLTYDARASFDYQFDQDMVWISTSAEAQTWQNKNYTNKWVTYTVTFTTTAIATYVQVNFQPRFSPGSNMGMIEYRNFSLKRSGIELLTNGNLGTGNVSPWTASNVTTVSNWTLGDATLGKLGSTTRLKYTGGSTITLAVAPDTYPIFYGLIDQIEPQPHQRGGPLTTVISALDPTVILVDQALNQPAQTNVTADQIMTLIYGLVQAGLFTGSQFDAGVQTYPFVFDGYSWNSTKLYDALRDAAMSDAGRFFVDRDGTLRFINKNKLRNAILNSPKLSLTDGLPFKMHMWTQAKMGTNEVLLTVYPRQIATTPIQLGALQTTLTIPPNSSAVTTLTYHDVSGRTIGGSGVYVSGWTASDVNGVDYSLQNTIVYISVAQFNASQALITFTNTGPVALYITSLTISGFPVYAYDPVIKSASDAASQARYGKITFNKVLPFSSSADWAQSLATYFITQYKDPFTEVDTVTTNHEVILNGVDVLSLELFDQINITDAQTQLSNVPHFIVAIDYQFSPTATDFLAGVTFTLERANPIIYWILGDSTYGKLGSTTRTAF